MATKGTPWMIGFISVLHSRHPPRKSTQANAEMKALYPSSIIDDKNKDGTPVTVKDVKGKDQPVGHWVNKDAHTTRPVMDTCLAALQLMVYYRYLPTTQLKATEVEVDVESLSKDKSNEINVTIDI